MDGDDGGLLSDEIGEDKYAYTFVMLRRLRGDADTLAVRYNVAALSS